MVLHSASASPSRNGASSEEDTAICLTSTHDLPGPPQPVTQLQTTESLQLWGRLCFINPGLLCKALWGLSGSTEGQNWAQRLQSLHMGACMVSLWQKLSQEDCSPTMGCIPFNLTFLFFLVIPSSPSPLLCFFFPLVKDTLLFYSSLLLL